MATRQWNICRRRPRPARYYQVFGPDPEYTTSMIVAKCLVGGCRCILYYGLLFLLIRWYLWPTVVPKLMSYELAQKAVNHSSVLLQRLKPIRDPALQ